MVLISKKHLKVEFLCFSYFAIMYSFLSVLVGMDESEIIAELHKAVQRKKFALGGHDDAVHIASTGNNRPMILIGG
jgi:hypothetical protein